MRHKVSLLATVALLALSIGVATASAGGGETLGWKWPNKVTSGVPVSVASLDPCPAVPTPGDTVLVQINLTFPGNGAEDQILFANADGSWSGNPTFSFSGVARKATISAECMDFNGFSAVPYAQYGSHVTMLSGG